MPDLSLPHGFDVKVKSHLDPSNLYELITKLEARLSHMEKVHESAPRTPRNIEPTQVEPEPEGAAAE